MHKGIMLKTVGGNNWIGGLYYTKNIAFSLLSNEYISKNYKIIIYTEKKYLDVFNDLSNKAVVIAARFTKGIPAAVEKLLLGIKYRVRYMFPLGRKLSAIGIDGISWIPDFQHKHLPQFFSAEELKAREERFTAVACSPNPLVLSSRDAENDFKKFYSSSKKNVYIVPFVSYIESFLRKTTHEEEVCILQKHGIEGKKFACVMNQFWQHKNHLLVLSALEKYYLQYPDSDLEVVFTGKLRDDTDPVYAEKIRAALSAKEIKAKVHILGFLERDEQLMIMKNAEFIIQPSLFEGWGTVVEDAKALDKTILLSDIPVHREQMSEKCILFNPYDADQLAELLHMESCKEHNDDIEKGIRNMRERALEYSRGFEQLLKEAEKSR